MISSLISRVKAAWPVLKWVVRLAILTLVLWGIARTWHDAQAEFASQQFSLDQLHVGWIVASCLLYVAGTLPSAWFWRETLQAMGQQPGWWETLRAYYVGHLGKYVPGKALVVVIRAAMIRSGRADPGVAALAVFVETLTLMAVGAVLSAVILVGRYLYKAAIGMPLDQMELFLTLVAAGLGLCAGVPTIPPIFRRIVSFLKVAKASPQVSEAIHGLRLGLMARGWLGLTVGWLLMGGSLWATLQALPATPVEIADFGASLPLMVACISLATVAGFMSLIPGGLFVRELIVTVLLAPVVGELAAIISAVVMRLVSLLSEVLVSIILYLGRGRSSP